MSGGQGISGGVGHGFRPLCSIVPPLCLPGVHFTLPPLVVVIMLRHAPHTPLLLVIVGGTTRPRGNPRLLVVSGRHCGLVHHAWGGVRGGIWVPGAPRVVGAVGTPRLMVCHVLARLVRQDKLVTRLRGEADRGGGGTLVASHRRRSRREVKAMGVVWLVGGVRATSGRSGVALTQLLHNFVS